MTRFTAIDLARLPPLPATALTFEQYYAAYMADLTARLNAVGIPYNVGSLQTDTYAVTGQAFSYRTELVAKSIDDAIAAVLLPTSFGAYLDLLGATQDPPVQRNVGELDPAYRARIQLAPEALSTCGPEGAYLFFATSVALADGTTVASASVYGPMSFGGTPANPFTPLGEVHIPILAAPTMAAPDGTASAALVVATQAALSADDRRPIADFVTVSAATVLAFTLDATLFVGPGADPGTVLTAAYARTRATMDLAHRPGGQVLDQDLYAALKVPDSTGAPVVGKVTLNGWSDVNGPDPVPSTIAPAYIAPFCAPPLAAPTSASVVSGVDCNGLSYSILVAGGITLRIYVVDG